ncbi:MAG: class I SAM-dependent methyltransferase [Pseudomonadota bacterium]
MSNGGFLDKAYDTRSDAETRQMYDRWAATYDSEVFDENGYQQPARCRDTLLALAPARDIAILDVGCGTGLAGVALYEVGYQCIDGCDFSEGMLDKARALGLYRRLFNADLNTPPMAVPDAHYDAATVVGVFSFGHVRADALDDILRVCKTDAPVVIGLNDHFYQEGSLTRHVAALDDAGVIDHLGDEAGEHIPGIDLRGWVISLRKR